MRKLIDNILTYQSTGPDGEQVGLFTRVLFNVVFPLLLLALAIGMLVCS
jgi:hypothetical protein